MKNPGSEPWHMYGELVSCLWVLCKLHSNKSGDLVPDSRCCRHALLSPFEQPSQANTKVPKVADTCFATFPFPCSRLYYVEYLQAKESRLSSCPLSSLLIPRQDFSSLPLVAHPDSQTPYLFTSTTRSLMVVPSSNTIVLLIPISQSQVISS